MTEHDLENIITAYDEGSFLKAARKLYVTQPALSQSIRKLEKQLGEKLFVCLGNRVEPTELCSHIVTLGRPVYNQWMEFQKKTDSLLRESRNSITVISSEGILISFLLDAIQRFKKTHKDIRLQIMERRTTEAEIELLEGKADLGLFSSALSGKHIVSVPILPTEYYLVIPGTHPYAASHPALGLGCDGYADLRDFQTSEFVFLRSVNSGHHEQMRIFEEAGFTPKAGIETATSNTLIDYVQSGLYCALIKSCYAQYYADLSNVRCYRLNLASARGYIYACRSNAQPFTPIIEDLLDEIRA